MAGEAWFRASWVQSPPLPEATSEDLLQGSERRTVSLQGEGQHSGRGEWAVPEPSGSPRAGRPHVVLDRPGGTGTCRRHAFGDSSSGALKSSSRHLCAPESHPGGVLSPGHRGRGGGSGPSAHFCQNYPAASVGPGVNDPCPQRARRPAHEEVTERRQLRPSLTRGMRCSHSWPRLSSVFIFLSYKSTGLKRLQEDAAISQVSLGYITM